METEEERRAAGKTDPGDRDAARAHRSGRVLIDVSDDGAGINRDRVLQIAIDKGLVPADAVLTDAGDRQAAVPAGIFDGAPR